MKKKVATHRRSLPVVVGLLLCPTLAASAAASQEQNAAPVATATSIQDGQAAGSVVPRLINFSGTIKDRMGKLQTGALDLTFSLYEEQDGGSPLWTETQKHLSLMNKAITACCWARLPRRVCPWISSPQARLAGWEFNHNYPDKASNRASCWLECPTP